NTTPSRPLIKGEHTTGATGFQEIYGGNQTHHYVQMTVTEFSEFWLHGSQVSQPLPVEMIYLQADAVNNAFIRVTWATAIEINNDGFEVERSVDGQNWTQIGYVDGHDNSTVQNNYKFDDMNVSPNVVYYYRLRQVDNDGAFEYTDIVSARLTGEISFSVAEFVPNPTMAKTNLVITGTKEQDITITFHNIVGQKVLEGHYGVNKGANRIEFDLGQLASGTYTAIVSSANEVYTRKVVLTR
ncbi:MAG TPA: T9SS type A sorting domain-containing protein, partial [Chitinophagales bacterium]|nr:T9SS type A sorting domain-containing protein [Chitinophagales bacterium]